MWKKEKATGYLILLFSLVSTTTLAYINTIIRKKSYMTTRRPSQHNIILSGELVEVDESKPKNNKSSSTVNNIKKSASLLALSTVFVTTMTSRIIVNAYETSTDDASDAVSSAVRMLKDASGNREKTFDGYENIRDMITEGKGVGGSLSYSGVDLKRGVVADEDTTIYNPGLTLLTESEKNVLVQAIVQSRKASLPTAETSWSDENESVYNFLKEKLDPFHLVEIGGYLKILPFWGALLYVGNIFVQQNARSIFSASYLLSVALVFGPILALVAFGS